MANVASSPVIAITGSAGYIGSLLLQKLENEESVGRLIAIDVKPLSMPLHNITVHRLDITESLDPVFHDHRINTVVHLAYNLRESRSPAEAAAIQHNNLQGLANLLRGCRTGRVRNIIYLSSHTVYGAYGDNPVPVTEEAPMRPLSGFQYGQTKARSEEMLQSFIQEYPDVGVTVLRCCMVMGPGGENYVARSFQQPALLKIWGHDPPLQFVHESDLARLLASLALDPRPGLFNVAGESVMRYSRLAQLLGRKLISLPPVVAYPLVQFTWKMGLQKSAPAVGLDLIRYPIVLSTGKLKQSTGFRFQYTAEEAVNSFVSSNLP
jgi:UDP-glucose 4-epimerase